MYTATDTKSIKFREKEIRFCSIYFPLFPNSLFCPPPNTLSLLNKLVQCLVRTTPIDGQIATGNLNWEQEPSSCFLLFIKFLCCGVGYFALVQYFYPW